MSRRKIKSLSRERKEKIPAVNLRAAAELSVRLRQQARKDNEDEIFNSLVQSKNFDLSRKYEYKYLRTIATDLEWAVNRLQKTIERYEYKQRTAASAACRKAKEKQNV